MYRCENCNNFLKKIEKLKKEKILLKKQIKERFQYWAISRGSYIIHKNYLEELELFLFTKKCKTLTYPKKK